MNKKVTWSEIYKDFRDHFPNLKKEVCDYRPYDFMTIKVWLEDGRMLTYNMLERKTTFLNERWKKAETNNDGLVD